MGMTHKTIFEIWHKDKSWELINYKKPWKENGVKPQFFNFDRVGA